jgi:hypothetical protein
MSTPPLLIMGVPWLWRGANAVSGDRRPDSWLPPLTVLANAVPFGTRQHKSHGFPTAQNQPAIEAMYKVPWAATGET